MGSAWVHRVHQVSPWLLALSWAMLLSAHCWNRTRHHGGGLPWVLSILWLSGWVMLANTAIFVVEEGLVGHLINLSIGLALVAVVALAVVSVR